MKIDKKYLVSAIVILLALLTAGIIQLSPPETPPDAPQFYFRNSFLALDLLGRATYNKEDEAMEYLLKNLSMYNRNEEISLWLKWSAGK